MTLSWTGNDSAGIVRGGPATARVLKRLRAATSAELTRRHPGERQSPLKLPAFGELPTQQLMRSVDPPKHLLRELRLGLQMRLRKDDPVPVQ